MKMVMKVIGLNKRLDLLVLTFDDSGSFTQNYTDPNGQQVLNY